MQILQIGYASCGKAMYTKPTISSYFENRPPYNNLGAYVVAFAQCLLNNNDMY